MSSVRIVNILFVFLFAAVAVFAGVFLYRDYQHLDYARKEKILLEQRLSGMQAEAAARSNRVAQLQGNPEYVEKVIREKLNFAKPDEVVFRFE